MNKMALIKQAVVSALGTGLYVVALVFAISHSNQWFGEQDLGWFVAVFMLLLFIISACVTSSLVLLGPVLLYVDGKKREGVTLFAYTVISLVVLALLVGGFLLSGLGPKLPEPSVPVAPVLTTKYITPVDWPPKIHTLEQKFGCKTATQLIGGREYCVTVESEGAAGSIYNQYAYAFAKGDQTIKLTFTLRLVQCANYSEPEQTACQAERSSFNPDPLVDGIARAMVQ